MPDNSNLRASEMIEDLGQNGGTPKEVRGWQAGVFRDWNI